MNARVFVLALVPIGQSGCSGPPAPTPLGREAQARATGAASAASTAASAAFFETGQAADLMLSGHGFNRTGGPLRFNHPGGAAVVRGNLVLADRNNNRVLVWSGIPGPNQPPALVLGQASFETNQPGEGLDGLNWPTAVAADGPRLYVADAYNDRVLVWRSLPARSGQAADFALTGGVRWPWGLWTDGVRLAVSSTGSRKVLLWNAPPESDRAPDYELQVAEFGTPRAVGSDGTRFVVSDHNARIEGRDGPGNFFWTSFPASASRFDFFMSAPSSGALPPGGGASNAPGEHIHALEFLRDGRLLALANRSLCIWSAFPRSGSDPCTVRTGESGPGSAGFSMDAGDNSGLALADGRLILSLNNGNRAIVWNAVPTASGQRPDYAIGSPDVDTNTLKTDAIITNAFPMTDGTRLWIGSDYDRTLHVWRSLPATTAQQPDHTYSLEIGPWAGTRVGNGLALVGSGGVLLWNDPPLGQPPDTVLRNSIGGVSLGQARGVAYDGTYFYVASYDQNRLWAWRGIPAGASTPALQIDVERPGRIASDGRILAVTAEGPNGGVLLYDVSRLGSGAAPVRLGSGPNAAGSFRFNLPQDVALAEGGLFVADTSFNRVLAWRDAASAAAGRAPDAVLGANGLEPPAKPWISQDRLFWPGGLAYDGRSLWVGEFKFSNRVLRFSAR